MNKNKLPNGEQLKAIIANVSSKTNIPAYIIEKDVWVTNVLQLVFSLPFADKLVFKGGTSLSKVYDLIQRFSEDIDLAIDRSHFGLEGDLTKKQLKKLRKASSTFVRDELVAEFNKLIRNSNLEKDLRLEVEPDGEGDSTYPEPRKIFIHYRSLYSDANLYVTPIVILEIGARSLFEPTNKVFVKSIVAKFFPQTQTNVYNPEVTVAAPQKTFLEKAFLLHELFSVNHGSNANRKSRHLYDLEKMMDKEFAIKAVEDDNLWNTISHHRQVFTSMRDVDYTPDIRKRICLIPPEEFMQEWRRDYDRMQSAMIYGPSLPFDQLLSRIRELENRFHHI